MSSSQSEEDCKYKHLLQPIRDLAANWDINIANDLEEYLVRLQLFGHFTLYSPTLDTEDWKWCRESWNISHSPLTAVQISISQKVGSFCAAAP